MKHNYTTNFLLKYLYGETSVLRKLEIENVIQEDNSVRQSFKEIQGGFRMLPKVSFYPSDDTLQSILDYSQQEAVSLN